MRVIVLGAGVLGAAVAARVAERGHDVTVLEAADSPAAGTSATTFGWVNGNNKLPEHYHRLNTDALREHHRLGGEQAGWLVGRGHLEYAVEPEHRSALAERVERLRASGYHAEFLTADAAAALEPDLRGVEEADVLIAWFPSEAHSYPERFIATMLASPAITLRTGHKVVAVEDGPRTATVHLSNGDTCAADAVVACLGRHTGTLFPEVPLVEPDVGNAAVGFLARTAPVSTRVSRVITTDTVNLRPAGGGALLLQTLDQDARADPASPVSTDVVTTMRQRVADRIGHPVRIESAIVGQRALPTDGLPVAGPLSEHRYVVASHSAVTLAPLLGELAAREICTGREQQQLQHYRPGRFAAEANASTVQPARRPGEQ